MEPVRIWVSANKVPGAGYFVWTIWECQGITEEYIAKYPNRHVDTLDGTYILPPICHHFWNAEGALDIFNMKSDEFTTPIQVGSFPTEG